MRLKFPGRGRHVIKALATATLLLTLLGFSVPQSSAQGNIMTTGTTINALANGAICWVDDAGVETCSDVEIHVSPGKFGESIIVCLDVYATSESGCADVASTFSMDTDNLTWAQLIATPVDLTIPVCEGKTCDYVHSRTVMLAASWSATGDLIHVNDTVATGYPHGPCTNTDHILGWVRDATTTVTLDGTSVDVYGNLQVLDSKTKIKTNCG